VVKACEGGKEKIIHFGQQGVSGSPKKKVSQKHIASVEKALKLDIQKILQKGRCLLHIGQLALSGDLNGKSKRKHDSGKESQPKLTRQGQGQNSKPSHGRKNPEDKVKVNTLI
jgi:hypothetical protein